MKFYDNQFMEQLKHQQKLLKIIQDEHKDASEKVKNSLQNEIQVREIWQNQIAVVDQLEHQLINTMELEECSL